MLELLCGSVNYALWVVLKEVLFRAYMAGWRANSRYSLYSIEDSEAEGRAKARAYAMSAHRRIVNGISRRGK